MEVTEKLVFQIAAALSAVLLLIVIWWWFAAASQGAASGFLRTADQQAQSLLRKGDAAAAAKRFRNPGWQAAASYRAGDFKQAAGIYAGLPGAEAAFNQGNALAMSGKYDAAVERYDAALQQRPDWQAALTNRKIAQERQKRIHHDGADMTGGKLAADKGIRFDKGAPKKQDQQQYAETESLDDGSMQDIWLRKVQTKPGDFLRSKFAYQLAIPVKAPEIPSTEKNSK